MVKGSKQKGTFEDQPIFEMWEPKAFFKTRENMHYAKRHLEPINLAIMAQKNLPNFVFTRSCTQQRHHLAVVASRTP